MYYYEQIDRATDEHICYLTCSMQLQDSHPTIRLVELTEEEYNQRLSEVDAEIQEDLGVFDQNYNQE